MKKFIYKNWYQLMIGTSLLMASFGFLVHSITPALAEGNSQQINVNSKYKLVPTNADGSISVKLSDEQLDKIIPKNKDGSINVKIPKNSPVSVNIQEVAGYGVRYRTSPVTGWGNRASLGVFTP